MSVAPSTTRGQLALSPSYFTSSLFVHPLREDIQHLIRLFQERYVQIGPSQPFTLFKAIWKTQGWTWMHLKVLDARSREAFLGVTARLFLERMATTETPLSRTAALFGLYTFFFTQPSPSAHYLYSISHVPIPIDDYIALMDLPGLLTSEDLRPLQPHVTHVLSTLVDAGVFYITPTSNVHAQNPRELPREMFIESNQEGPNDTRNAPKKKGRPSKLEKLRKAREALGKLEKWLDQTNAGQSNTHTLLSNPPTTSRCDYQTQKLELIGNLAPGDATVMDGNKVLERANYSVLSRLRRIDEMAAEQGLEVGGEGGERTGLERVERVVLETERGGILSLLEGGGLN